MEDGQPVDPTTKKDIQPLNQQATTTSGEPVVDSGAPKRRTPPPPGQVIAIEKEPEPTNSDPANADLQKDIGDFFGGQRFFSGDTSPATRPTHNVVLETAANSFAIGMRGARKVDAALVCQPENKAFNLGTTVVWIDIDEESPLIGDFKGPTVTMDGLKIGLALSLRIDGKVFTPKDIRALGGRPNGKPPSLIGTLENTDDLFDAMEMAKRVEILGNDRVLMIETGGRTDELAKIVDGCKEISGWPFFDAPSASEPKQKGEATPHAAPSGTEGPDPAILALEEKYQFSALARELLATSQGTFAYGRQDYKAAYAWLSSEQAKSNPAANHYLAVMAEMGNIGQPDFALALRKYAEAANAGFYLSQLRLGQIYLRGEFPGLQPDPRTAKPWLIMAAKESRGEANRMLSEMGVPSSEIEPTRTDLEKALGRSYQEALSIANTLASQGVGSANYWAGSFISEGRGTPANPTLGRDLMFKAARLYDAPALIDVAIWTSMGNGVARNRVEAATIGYISRENVVYSGDAEMVEKRLSQITDGLSDENFNDVRRLLSGIREISARVSNR